MMASMLKVVSIVAAALFATSPAPAFADAGNFTLVNSAGVGMSAVSIRRHGTEDWRPLAVSPSAGASSPVQFSDPDCAFDIQAKLAGGTTATWSGVNLCEAKSVILNRDGSGAVWVDYD